MVLNISSRDSAAPVCNWEAEKMFLRVICTQSHLHHLSVSSPHSVCLSAGHGVYERIEDHSMTPPTPWASLSLLAAACCSVLQYNHVIMFADKNHWRTCQQGELPSAHQSRIHTLPPCMAKRLRAKQGQAPSLRARNHIWNARSK